MSSFFKYSKLHISEAHALRVLHGFTDDVIRKRRKELTENINNNESVRFDDVDIPNSRALLDLLLHSTIDGEPFSLTWRFERKLAPSCLKYFSRFFLFQLVFQTENNKIINTFFLLKIGT